jgi:hypothetical protein
MNGLYLCAMAIEQIPFTLDQANEIVEDFEDLVETEITLPSGLFLINHVVVTPFSNEDKRTFFHVYADTSDVSKAITFYQGNTFDVLIIAYKIVAPDAPLEEREVVAMPIQEYVTRFGINYNFPSAE